ncbi:hypothetical protein OUZ56_029515 [Daphnia magna]|uniref:Uncharacterized protein n=1 Tax=Daphnia magna TaxID=35525 RepID=A0ABR0B717_9CRUS|nr:hypothetical protein OUZ56_029515 [Daphnia magna]
MALLCGMDGLGLGNVAYRNNLAYVPAACECIRRCHWRRCSVSECDAGDRCSIPDEQIRMKNIITIPNISQFLIGNRILIYGVAIRARDKEMAHSTGRVDGVMDTSGQGWLPVNIFVVVNGVGVEFLNVILEIGARFQMRC